MGIESKEYDALNHEERKGVIMAMRMTVGMAREWVDFMNDYPEEYPEDLRNHCSGACRITESIISQLDTVFDEIKLEH